ncbi:MAG: hypothetical protein OWQ48_03985 [Desulfurococcus sp.]|nr:hypothetical protein [Desulfurococcus sp.]
MSRIRELDLTSSGSCSENPLTTLLDVLKKQDTEVRVKSKPEILPEGLARLLGLRYGYEVVVLEAGGGLVEYLFKRK